MLKIGLLGMGTVGSGVVKIMENNRSALQKKIGIEFKIEKILVKNINKKRELDLSENILTVDPDEILENPEIDLVVELIGGEEPAYGFILKALKSGKSIVTANKLIIARYGEEIQKIARDNDAGISYEGSVAGGLPIIRPLKDSLAANRIEEIYGILNGTTNYILTMMTREGSQFSEVLEKAQKLGYAERDPESDISGKDAAYKIAILSSIAFESFVNVNDVYTEGIETIDPVDIDLADELGYVVKLMALAKKSNNELDIRVHPAFIAKSHPMALVNGVYNAVYIHGDAVGDVMSYGKGAGQMPTASAVVADIIQAGRCIVENRPGDTLINTSEKAKLKSIEEVKNSFYLRIQVNDKPGVMARVTRVFGDRKVSLASVLQKHRLSKIVPLVLITHPVKEKYINSSLSELKALDDVIDINSVIRVVEEPERGHKS